MLRTACALLLILFSQVAFAQMELGARVGVNYSDIKVSNYNDPIIDKIETRSDLGFEFGFYARANIMRVYVQPEITYSQLNGTLDILTSDEMTQSYDMTIHRMDVPIPIGFKFGSFQVFAGPLASFNMGSASMVLDEGFHHGGWSILAGVGAQFGNMMLEVRYISGLQDYANQLEIPYNGGYSMVNMDMRVSQLLFTVGYTFNSAQKN